MKKFRLFTLLLAVVALLVACDKNTSKEDDIDVGDWDYNPLVLKIYATDGTNNLFDPTYEGNICKSMSVTFNGQDYFYSPPSALRPKLYDPIFSGLQLEQSKEGYYMSFGEMNRDGNNINYAFIVNWPDGVKDKIEFSLTRIWKGRTPEVTERFLVNGKLSAPYDYRITRIFSPQKL